jgi:ABC-type sugar transport system permease subunit
MLYEAVGLSPRLWLLSPERALLALAIMSVWQGVGFQMIVFVAGLQNVSTDLLDAAKIDGAGALRRVVSIIVPQMKRTIALNFVVTTILSFRLFVQPYLLTRGGPNDRTLSVIEWIYETTFLQHDLGRACAGVVIFLCVVGVLTAVQRRLLEEPHE